jgi:hypothetical protein
MQLLAGANLVDVDFGLKEDRALFGGAQKRGSRGPIFARCTKYVTNVSFLFVPPTQFSPFSFPSVKLQSMSSLDSTVNLKISVPVSASCSFYSWS